MRVLFYVGETAGSRTARAELVAARALAGRGHRVTVACGTGSRIDQLAADAGLQTVPIAPSAWAGSDTLDLRRVIKERLIDAAVVTRDRDHLIVASAVRAAGRGAVLRRVPAFDTLAMQRTGRLALKMAAAGLIIGSAEELATTRLRGWSLPATVAPLGVDTAAYDAIDAIERSAIRVPERSLLVACGYDPSGRQRIGTLFRTLALLASRHSSLHVVIFGPGSRDDEVRMHASALGLGPIVTFLGEREDELRIMRAAAVGWIVSSGDAAAFAALDFMALRVPVIADRTALAQHYVADGITGVLLSPGDATSMASAVAAFLTGNTRRSKMGDAARARVQREFSESKMINGFESAVLAAGNRAAWSTK